MEIKARVPGMIVDVKVNEGDHVEVKDVLMVMGRPDGHGGHENGTADSQPGGRRSGRASRTEG